MTEFRRGHLLVMQSAINEMMAVTRSPQGSWEIFFLTEGPFPLKFKSLFGTMAVGVTRAREIKLLELGESENVEIVTECELSDKKTTASLGFIFDKDIQSFMAYYQKRSTKFCWSTFQSNRFIFSLKPSCLQQLCQGLLIRIDTANNILEILRPDRGNHFSYMQQEKAITLP